MNGQQGLPLPSLGVEEAIGPLLVFIGYRQGRRNKRRRLRSEVGGLSFQPQASGLIHQTEVILRLMERLPRFLHPMA
jgi:hypothetical protein